MESLMKKKIILLTGNSESNIGTAFMQELQNKGYQLLPLVYTNLELLHSQVEYIKYLNMNDFIKKVLNHEFVFFEEEQEEGHYYGVLKSDIIKCTEDNVGIKYYSVMNTNDAIKMKQHSPNDFVLIYTSDIDLVRKTVFFDEMVDLFLYSSDADNIKSIVANYEKGFLDKKNENTFEGNMYTPNQKITRQEKENAIKEIMDRIYDDGILDYEGEIGDVTKIVLIQALIEHKLKNKKHSYSYMQQEEKGIYTVNVDQELFYKIIIEYQRAKRDEKLEIEIKTEVYWKKDIVLQEKDRIIDLLRLLDKINSSYYGCSLHTVLSSDDSSLYAISGVIATKSYNGFHHPFCKIEEFIGDMMKRIEDFCSDMSDVKSLLNEETSLNNLLEKRQYIWMRQ